MDVEQEPVDQSSPGLFGGSWSAGAVTLPHPAIKMVQKRPVSVFKLARARTGAEIRPAFDISRKNQACQEHCGAGCQQDSIFAV